jgi:polysaccharide biosynthesis/export protein
MFSIRQTQGHKPVRRHVWAGCCLGLLTFMVLHAWSLQSAGAQPPAPQSYRIATGDKIGVVVFGQPDLSGEATVDQNGNLRLPVVGDIHAASLTPRELEQSISRSLEQGYVRRPVVSVKIAEFRPIYVLGMVRTPGLFAYREGLTVLGAIARAGGIGDSKEQQTNALRVMLEAEERVRLLEIRRVTLLARRARLVAQQNGEEDVVFPVVPDSLVDPARVAQIHDGELRIFAAERQAEQREIEALQKQLPRLAAEIAALKQQADLERKQRDLNHEMVEDLEKLMKSGLARKPTYIEVKREEARIEGNIGRLETESLRADLAVAEVQFKITGLHNSYARRVMTELRETDQALLELSVTLPSARHVRAAHAQQIGLQTSELAVQPAITVVRTNGAGTEKHDVAVDFLLQPGDVVQVGPLFPLAQQPSAYQIDQTGAKKRQSGTPSPAVGAVAPRIAIGDAGRAHQ